MTKFHMVFQLRENGDYKMILGEGTEKANSLLFLTSKAGIILSYQFNSIVLKYGKLKSCCSEVYLSARIEVLYIVGILPRKFENNKQVLPYMGSYL